MSTLARSVAGLPGDAPRRGLRAAPGRPPARRLRRLLPAPGHHPGHHRGRPRVGHPAQRGEPDLVGDAAGGGPRLRGAPADRRGRHRGPPEGSAAPPGVADDAVSVLPDRDHRADRRRSRAGSPAAGGELRDPDRADGRHRAAHRGGDGAGPRGRGPRRGHAHDPAFQARQVPSGAAARDHHDGARGLRGAPRPAVPAPRDGRASSSPAAAPGSTTPTPPPRSPACSRPPGSRPRPVGADRGSTTCATASPSPP